MIHAGVCSLTLPHLPLDQVVEEARQAGLNYIEWWGKDHVPHGDIDAAVKAGELTRGAGLQVSSYGSYYRLGDGEDFEDVFETALAMEAPAVRVWAGTKGSEEASAEYRETVIGEALLVADTCVAADVQLILEYHGGSLTDTDESTAALVDALQHPGIHFGWQPRTGRPVQENLAALKSLVPRLGTVHVFNWSNDPDGKRVRHALADGADEWKEYFKVAGERDHDHVALLEFVKDGSVEQFRADAATLLILL